MPVMNPSAMVNMNIPAFDIWSRLRRHSKDRKTAINGFSYRGTWSGPPVPIPRIGEDREVFK